MCGSCGQKYKPATRSQVVSTPRPVVNTTRHVDTPEIPNEKIAAIPFPAPKVRTKRPGYQIRPVTRRRGRG